MRKKGGRRERIGYVLKRKRGNVIREEPDTGKQ